ncbi:hypothetical protein AB0O28_39470 [Microbispora sp. NPDC088329]|uniref:hypothetical protein n=1 Tax=Microbispora sp. NPDC088329 TaxID=3154869 RepID=UPI0034374278
MADEITAGRIAARALAARTPGWMVWYGERTGSFWAVPRVATAIVPRLLEAPTADDLEEEIRQAEGRPAREQTREQTRPGEQSPTQQATTQEATTQEATTQQTVREAARHRRSAAETPAPRIPVSR